MLTRLPGILDVKRIVAARDRSVNESGRHATTLPTSLPRWKAKDSRVVWRPTKFTCIAARLRLGVAGSAEAS